MDVPAFIERVAQFGHGKLHDLLQFGHQRIVLHQFFVGELQFFKIRPRHFPGEILIDQLLVGLYGLQVLVMEHQIRELRVEFLLIKTTPDVLQIRQQHVLLVFQVYDAFGKPVRGECAHGCGCCVKVDDECRLEC